MQGKIIKIHSDFYYIKILGETGLVECKARNKLKKEKTDIFVGDSVKIEEVSMNLSTGVITEVLPRKNFLSRPSVANIDRVIIVTSLFNPELDFIQLNRYLCMAKLYDLPAVICVNKADLGTKNELKQKVFDIYTKLGYKVIFTSALTGEGIDDFKKVLESNLCVLSGVSGAGKSSLINKLSPELNLRTKNISLKSGKGTHTTRHTEILEILTEEGKILQITDTPGFSLLKFDIVMPSVINELFDEIKELSADCGFSDCLHLSEENCNVLANSNKINPERYESYKIFVREATEYKERLYEEGHKKENRFKASDIGNKEKNRLVKLSVQARQKSRKTLKQETNNILISDEMYED